MAMMMMMMMMITIVQLVLHAYCIRAAAIRQFESGILRRENAFVSFRLMAPLAGLPFWDLPQTTWRYRTIH
jgi:hypothetical protein